MQDEHTSTFKKGDWVVYRNGDNRQPFKVAEDPELVTFYRPGEKTYVESFRAQRLVFEDGRSDIGDVYRLATRDDFEIAIRKIYEQAAELEKQASVLTLQYYEFLQKRHKAQ